MRRSAAVAAVALLAALATMFARACVAPSETMEDLPPPPRVFAFVSGLGGAELARLRSVGHRLDVVAPNWFALDVASGRVRGGGPHTERLRRTANAAGAAVWPVVNARMGEAPTILGTAWRERAAQGVASLAAEAGYAGMTLDVEELAPEHGPAFTALVQRTAALLHGQGRRLAVYVPRPFTRFGAAYDWPALAAAADLVLASGYNEHAPGSRPGPVATAGGFATVLEHAAAVSRTRVAPTLGAFGYRWPRGGGRGKLVSTTTAGRLRRQCRLRGARKDGAVRFTCRGGVVVYESQSGLVARALAARRAGFRWLALFSLGREPAGFWRHVATARRRAPPPSAAR